MINHCKSVLNRFLDKAIAFEDSVKMIRSKQAEKLKKRLRIFLCIYLTGVFFMMMFGFSSDAIAKESKKGNTGEASDIENAFEDWREETSDSNIYNYEAGDNVDYGSSIPFQVGNNVLSDGMEDFNKQANDWIYQQLFTASTGVMDSGDLEDSNFIWKMIKIVLYNLINLWYNTNVIFVRIIIVYPFFYLEMMLNSLGPNFFPKSLYGLFLGRVGSGGYVTNNIFGFELVENNIYGVVGSIFYSFTGSIVIIGLGIRLIASLAGAAWSNGSGEARRKLKESLGFGIVQIILLGVTPYLVYMACYIRDNILFEALRMTEWASRANMTNGTSVDVMRQGATAAASFFINASRSVGLGSGNSYNPFLDRALDFTNGTAIDSLMYAGTSILLYVFIFIYISLALDTMLTFGFAPITILSGKEALMDGIKHLVANLLTPVMDMLVLSIPLLLGSVTMQGADTLIGVTFIELVICFSYFPLRSSIRAKLGLRSAERSEGMGMGSMMMMMGAMRAVGSGIQSIAGAAASAGGAIENGSAGMDAADLAGDMDMAAIKDTSNRISDIQQAEKNIDGSGSLTEDADSLNPENPDLVSDSDEKLDEAGRAVEENEQSLNDIKDSAAAIESEDNDSQSEAALSAENETGMPGDMEKESDETAQEDELEDYSTGSAIADSNIKQAVESSNLANAMEQKKLQKSEEARQYNEKAQRLQAEHSRNQAKIAADPMNNEKKQEILAKNAKIKADMDNYRAKACAAQNQSRRYGELQSRAEDVCNSVRQRMGIGGRGRLSAQELSQYSALQRNANVGNFMEPLMQKSLAPDLQKKFYLQARQNAGMGLAAGIATTTALSGITLAGSMFLPPAAKAAALGTSVGVGGAVMRMTQQGLNRAGSGGTMGVSGIDYGLNSGSFNYGGTSANIEVDLSGSGVPSPADTGNPLLSGAGVTDVVVDFGRNMLTEAPGSSGIGQHMLSPDLAGERLNVLISSRLGADIKGLNDMAFQSRYGMDRSTFDIMLNSRSVLADMYMYGSLQREMASIPYIDHAAERKAGNVNINRGLNQVMDEYLSNRGSVTAGGKNYNLSDSAQRREYSALIQRLESELSIAIRTGKLGSVGEYDSLVRSILGKFQSGI